MPVSTARVRRDVRGWLVADDQVSELLGDGNIVPAYLAADDDSNPQLAIGVSFTSLDKPNVTEESVYSVRIITSGRLEWARLANENNADRLEQLRDRVARVMTKERAGYYEPSLTNDEEFAPNTEVDRLFAVSGFRLIRREHEPHRD